MENNKKVQQLTPLVKNKKPFWKKWWVWLIIVFVIIGIVSPEENESEITPTENKSPETKVERSIEKVLSPEQTEINPKPVSTQKLEEKNRDESIFIAESEPQPIEPEPQPEVEPEHQPIEPEPQPEVQNESQPKSPEPEAKIEAIFPLRENALAIIKENASIEWGNDYGMVKYETDNQTASYNWLINEDNYPDIMVRAYKEWGNDYGMVKYEYENQVEAYEWINKQTEYPDIMTRAKQEWEPDYGMVKYEYENQVEAYESL